jgi:DNA-binding response OmpR family regulator
MEKILLIDDDDDFRESLKDYLVLEGYAVCCAKDGEQGMVEFEQQAPALVVCDMIMPEKDGIEMICHLRRHYNSVTVKFVAISGGGRLVGTECLDSAKMLGADAVFEKPLDLDSFLATVNALLNEGDGS